MRSNLMRGSSCLSKLGGRYAHQRLSFQANGHPIFKGARRCKRYERKNRHSASHDEQRSSSNLSDTRHFVAAVEELPSGSHPAEGAMIGLEVAL